MTDRSLAQALTQADKYLIGFDDCADGFTGDPLRCGNCGEPYAVHLIRQLRAAAARVGERPAWQPIETAPKVGDVLLTDGAYKRTGYWAHRREAWVADSAVPLAPPTHWAHLPTWPAASPVSAPGPPREETPQCWVCAGAKGGNFLGRLDCKMHGQLSADELTAIIHERERAAALPPGDAQLGKGVDPNYFMTLAAMHRTTDDWIVLSFREGGEIRVPIHTDHVAVLVEPERH